MSERFTDKIGEVLTPEFLENSRRDTELVHGEFQAAMADGRPIDEEFIGEVAQKRFEQAQTYHYRQGAPGASLESSTSIVRENVAIFLLFETVEPR